MELECFTLRQLLPIPIGNSSTLSTVANASGVKWSGEATGRHPKLLQMNGTWSLSISKIIFYCHGLLKTVA